MTWHERGFGPQPTPRPFLANAIGLGIVRYDPAIDAERTALAGQALGYTREEALEIICHYLADAHQRPWSIKDALVLAQVEMATRVPGRPDACAWRYSRDRPCGAPYRTHHTDAWQALHQYVPPPPATYLGWPMHSRSFATENARLGLALRLAFDRAGLYRALDRISRFLAWIDSHRKGWR